MNNTLYTNPQRAKILCSISLTSSQALKFSSFNFTGKLLLERFPMKIVMSILSKSLLPSSVTLLSPDSLVKLISHLVSLQSRNHISTMHYFFSITHKKKERNEKWSSFKFKKKQGSILKHEFLRQFHFQFCSLTYSHMKTSVSLMNLLYSTEAHN